MSRDEGTLDEERSNRWRGKKLGRRRLWWQEGEGFGRKRLLSLHQKEGHSFSSLWLRLNENALSLLAVVDVDSGIQTETPLQTLICDSESKLTTREGARRKRWEEWCSRLSSPSFLTLISLNLPVCHQHRNPIIYVPLDYTIPLLKIIITNLCQT